MLKFEEVLILTSDPVESPSNVVPSLLESMSAHIAVLPDWACGALA